MIDYKKMVDNLTDHQVFNKLTPKNLDRVWNWRGDYLQPGQGIQHYARVILIKQFTSTHGDKLGDNNARN